MNDPIVGIDLGTTNSVVARADDAGDRVLIDGDKFKIQPSVVAFHPNGSVMVGAGAKQRKVIDPQNTVYSAKRLIGRTFSSPEVTAALERMPYAIKPGANDQPVIATRAGEFAVPEISAIVLDHMRTIAKANLGAEIERAVVTVPANFTEAQRSATATAGAIAGITIVRVLNEPTAAALAYGHNRDLNQIIAVYDFGGGTFDITVLRLHNQVYKVLGTAGDSFLGGDDIDERLVDVMVDEFLKTQRIDLRENAMSMMRLRQVAEQTKIQLSRRSRAIIKIDEIAYGSGGKALNLELEINRDQLIASARDVVDRTFPVCEEAISISGVRPQDVDDVVLVGGTTKMPYVRQSVARFFGREPRIDVNPDEAVAVGAALQARSLEKLLAPDEPGRATRRGAVGTSGGIAGAAGAAGAAAAAIKGAAAAVTFGDDASNVRRPRRRTQPGLGAMEPPSTERRAQRGEFRDELTPPVVEPGKALARITRRGTTAPPPIPTRPQRTTLMGAPPSSFDEATDVQTNVRGSGANNLPIELPPVAGSGLPNLPQFSHEGGADDDAPTFPGASAPSQALTSLDLMGGASASSAATSLDMGQQARPAAPTIVDVTTHTLGIGTVGGYCEGLIARNSHIPTRIIKTFSTSRDMQDIVRIRVCQGESRRIGENLVLGDLVLEGLQKKARGETKIEVTFDIDAGGMLNVMARDPQTGIQQQATLHVLGAQSPEQVDAARERLREIRS